MEALQQEVLKRVENMLRGIGAQYAIKLGDELRGELRIAPPETGIRRPKLFYFERDLAYTKDLKSMEPGSIKTWHLVASEEYATRFLSTVRTWCNREWGRDNFVATIESDGEKRKISVLRG